MTFEDLDAWKRSRMQLHSIYAPTRNESPTRDFRLCSQLQRAAVSVMTNIAEGFTRTRLPENVARASAGEVRSPLYVVAGNFPAAGVDTDGLHNDTVAAGKLVSGLLASTKKRRGGITRLPSAFLALVS